MIFYSNRANVDERVYQAVDGPSMTTRTEECERQPGGNAAYLKRTRMTS